METVCIIQVKCYDGSYHIYKVCKNIEKAREIINNLEHPKYLTCPGKWLDEYTYKDFYTGNTYTLTERLIVK